MQTGTFRGFVISMERPGIVVITFNRPERLNSMSDHHPDAQEGVRAFREKRVPRFNRWLEEAEG